MKITINTSTSSFDPAETCSPAELDEAVKSYGRIIEIELKKAFPTAEIEHNVQPDDVTYSHDVTGCEDADYDDIKKEIQRIIEAVYETGNFW